MSYADIDLESVDVSTNNLTIGVVDENDSTEDFLTQKVGRTGNTTKEELEHILNWMEIKNNFKWLIGRLGEHSTCVNGKKLRRHDAYIALRGYLIEMLKLGEDEQKKYSLQHVENITNSYLRKFKNTCRAVYSTGFGLSESDLERSLTDLVDDMVRDKKDGPVILKKVTQKDKNQKTTLSEEINRMCYGFKRLEALYGEHPGIQPPYSKSSVDSDIIKTNRGLTYDISSYFGSQNTDVEDHHVVSDNEQSSETQQPPTKISSDRKRRKTQDSIVSLQQSSVNVSKERLEIESAKFQSEREFQDKTCKHWEEELKLKRQQMEEELNFKRQQEISAQARFEAELDLKKQLAEKRFKNERLEMLLKSNLFFVQLAMTTL
ncbi:hypothetical protein HDV06_004606 [Boothiomyces sp. JEL0866]|nr:hypothetical protein HDV06_004606 [Boothiomyces sp. JEL0866]